LFAIKLISNTSIEGVISLILGVGIDIVSIKRIERVYNKYPDRLIKRLLTRQEENLFVEKGSPVNTLAALYAAKEAVLKAIGCGIGPASFNEVEVIAFPGRQPRVELYGEALRLAAEKRISDVAVSVAHEPPFACACATAFNVPGNCN